MGLHARGWSDIQFMAFATEPMLAMRIEQGLAAASPANETRIESFEDYGTALDHCKASGSIGLIFLSENLTNLPPLGVFKNFSTPFEEKRGPCFGVLLHDGKETIQGHSAMRFSKGRILEYVSTETVIKPELAAPFLVRLWNTYINAFEQTIFPERIQESINQLIDPLFPKDERNFATRLATLLNHQFSLSWWEGLAVRLFPLAKALEKSNPQFAATLPELRNIVITASPTQAINGPMEIASSKLPLPQRVSMLIELLLSAYRSNTLPAVLGEIQKLSTPGTPALLRRTASVSNSILTIATESRQDGEKRAA